MTAATRDRSDELFDEVEALGERIRALLILIAEFAEGEGAKEALSEVATEAAAALAGRPLDGAANGVGRTEQLGHGLHNPDLSQIAAGT